jgi:hypothetical protein
LHCEGSWGSTSQLHKKRLDTNIKKVLNSGYINCYTSKEVKRKMELITPGMILGLVVLHALIIGVMNWMTFLFHN